jgi:hypothetical protein
MKHMASLLRALPILTLPGAVLLPRLLTAISPDSYPLWRAISFQLYYATLVCIWLLAVALTLRTATNHQISQFSLKALLGAFATSAIGLAAVFNGSVFSFVVLLLFTAGATAWLLYSTWRFRPTNGAFCLGFCVLICIGAVWSLLAPSPVTQTRLVRIMWWDITEWGNGLAWNMASFLGAKYLLFTWLAAYGGGLSTSAISSMRQRRNDRLTTRSS